MLTDVTDLREFYSSALGNASSKSIANALLALWGNCKGERVLGLGYTTPWLDRFGPDCERVLNFMPAAQGAVQWPFGKPSATALAFEEELPLADASIDRIVMVHLLEHSENPTETLREIWRVLAPNGKLFIVVPNRRGLWARFEHTPFGTGRPFSKGQLTEILRAALLTPVSWSDALHFPPGKISKRPFLQNKLEKFGRRFWPVFSGAILVQATKKLYQGIPALERQSRRIFVPVLMPQGSSQTKQNA
ncbi:MAG: methyltransferase domain-containing protein, partial [Rhizobiaceae bacterium]|nr:methyltransferase domain-containing protein [Rhizobiaceae bacterium]